MEEITIVTAYFDIKRDKIKNFERTTEDYFDYFTKWAKLKNMLVVFVENKKIKDKIIEFRSGLGLKNKTIVIIVENIKNIAPNMYSLIKNTINNDILLRYRLRPGNLESNKPLYNYIMLLKAWCINYAVNNLEIKTQIAWIDFGFNHGGAVYDLKSNFNIEWSYNFGEKITLFNLQPLDNRPIFDIILSMDTYIMGSIIIVPYFLAAEFWELAQDCTKILADVGLSDDDQIIWLMCNRIKSDKFVIKKVLGWHTALKEYGCNSLVLKEKPKINKIKLILKKIKYKFEVLNYLKRIYTIASEWTQQ